MKSVVIFGVNYLGANNLQLDVEQIYRSCFFVDSLPVVFGNDIE